MIEKLEWLAPAANLTENTSQRLLKGGKQDYYGARISISYKVKRG